MGPVMPPHRRMGPFISAHFAPSPPQFNLALLACIGSGAEAGACATGAGNKQQQGGPQVEVHV